MNPKILITLMMSYLMPTLMAAMAGWLLADPTLIRASYSTIALPSLATALLYCTLFQTIKAPRWFGALVLMHSAMGLLVPLLLWFPQLLAQGWQMVTSVAIATLACSLNLRSMEVSK